MKFRSVPKVVAAAAILTLSSLDASAQVKAGPEFRANTTTAGAQDRPATAAEPDGDFIVVWHGAGPGDSDDGIFGQRFSRDGSPRGGEFRANTFTTSYQLFPKVAVNARGNFVVVWESFYQNGYRTIFGQRFDATGATVGTEFQVNSYTTGYRTYASGVTMDARGGFVVVWTSDQSDGTDNYGVRGQRFDASGARLGAEFAVNSYTTGYQEGSTSATQIAGTPDGRFVVVWESDDQDGSGYGVFGQRFDATGARVGAEFQVNTYTTANQDEPAVGMAADGRFVVVWESDFAAPAYQDIRGQRYNADGTRAGAEFQASANTLDNQFVYGVAVDNQANFVVAWDDYDRDGSSYGQFGQRFSSTATPRGAEFLVNTYTTGYQGVSQARSDEVGNFVVAWHSTGQDGDGRGVFGQRFGGLFPISLSVNATGNGVWEPGESVDVRPTWRNHAGSPQTFTGALSNLTGPAGATYTLTDGAASYGTVADNTNAPCTDCYTVAVDNPASRPEQHWDASALESIAPDTQGQQKRWALHIGRSFTDVPTNNAFYRFIETVFHHGITGGCSPTQYCPGSPTLREQMAVFMLVAKEGAGYAPPACGTPMFNDVPANNPFCRFIEELARRGVVSGCGGGNYCPTAAATREQMAVFVLRTLDPALNPPACVPPNDFNDVPETSPFCRWIEELARRGVVTGCGGGSYCPMQPVTREQMAVFIVVTFGLSLYGP